ncbi:MAG: polyamine ABC transporter substrate-binding protein [Geminicoccus sp.]|nr:polyamine ABC transporter substrate-binding protein [Geminicoccus sp.]
MKKLMRTALVAVGAMSLASSSALAQDSELIIFDWAGYEDPEFFTAYTAKHGDSPTFTYFGDEEEAFQKLRTGFRTDAVHPCSQSVPRWIEAGLIAPLDTSRIDRWDEVNKAFRDIPAFQKDGEYYFVPVDWGNTATTYNTELLSEADVQSLQAFADPKHRGRISLPDNVDDAYALGFLAVGVKDWANASMDEFQQASDFLRKVNENVRDYWSDGASLAQLMQSGEVYLAWAWNETFSTMSYEGFPIAMKRDTDEGSSSWVCGYAKSANAPGSEDKFYDFINAWLEPSTADYIVTWWGYGHSNEVAMSGMSNEDLAAVGLESSEKLRDGTLWQGPVPAVLREAMIAEFENIKAGF